jgi:hypothetical protein
MSPRSSDPPPAPGIYEALLFVSLAAVIIGVFFLFFELSQYEFKIAG